MKTIWLIVMSLTVSIGAADKAGQPDMPRTVTESFDRSVSSAESALLRVAVAMPEDKYNFAPVNGEFKGVRTFAQMVKHVAVDQYVDAAALLKEKTPIDPGTHMNGPDSIRTKAEILKFLQDGFTYMHRAIHTVNQKNLMELVKFDQVNIPRLSIVSSAISHPWDHYGQLIEYLRMNGIDPQAQY
ncbi:MAG TPA: DinB family protein [Candidatus Angelobacter sp.]